jgi:hypothetical protein
MNQSQNEILAWWYGKRDYRTGVTLLSRYSKNKILASTLSKHGKENFPANVKKLHYEVTKAVNLNWNKMPPDTIQLKPETKQATTIKPEKKPDKKSTDVSKTDLSAQDEKPFDDTGHYPRVIRRLKYEYSNSFNQRSRLHFELKKIDPANTDANNQKRAQRLAEIKFQTSALEHLYPFIENFEKNGIVPDEFEVWPMEEKPKKHELPATLPELKKLINSIRREYNKDGFRLLYQQRTIAEKENPMPPGSKRDAIEVRMKMRQKRMNEIQAEILKLENAD